ncbi:hypothetical protein IVB30_20100 [Bradyrhizobium sp. 200]|uniref:hypothetical protein n=1 Tax=Bradyrhizobium sp. 200 TaxID=2782665 RepID=UPI001FFF6685|nr:hypothetical protein [Bradyrhizobium sp. 200]UPJ53411.1 hypothetical protein IVB30_20100 [Bradyrhizobium sp. 200]
MTHIDWRDRLVAENRRLFLRKIRGRAYAAGRPDVGDGWRSLIERAVESIRRAAAGHTVLISRIKSSSGSVRICWEAEASLPREIGAAIDGAVDLAAARSRCGCEICGSVGALWRCGERLATACDEHGVGIPQPIPSGCENLHVVLGFENGLPAPIRYRRYDPKSDSLAHVSNFEAEAHPDGAVTSRPPRTKGKLQRPPDGPAETPKGMRKPRCFSSKIPPRQWPKRIHGRHRPPPPRAAGFSTVP